MPVAKNPHLPEFFVYTLLAEGHPFYVGIGRAGRAEDRVRWVRSQINRELQGLKAKWVCHTRVMRELIELGIAVKARMPRTRMDRAAALVHERTVIGRLKRRGVLLANKHLNSDYTGTVADIVADLVRRIVLDRIERRSAL